MRRALPAGDPYGLHPQDGAGYGSARPDAGARWRWQGNGATTRGVAMKLGWAAWGVIGFAAIGGAAFLLLREQLDLARIGTAYVAKQTCSCLYVGGRTPDSCASDYDPDIYRLFSVRIETETATQAVSTQAFSIFRARAVFEPGFGCTLVE